VTTSGGEAAPDAVVVVDESLGRQVRVGLGWSVVNTGSGRLLTLVMGIVLARILEPRDYGIYTVGLVALNILQSMNELGVSVAIVRWQGDPARVARTAFTMSLTASCLLYAAIFLAAPTVASTLRTPEATGILRLLTVGVLLDGFSSIPNALLTRALLQGRRAIADGSALVVTMVVTLVLATRGEGAWSLAWGSLAGNFTATCLVYALAPSRPRPGFDRGDAWRLLNFGLPLAGSSFLVFAMLNVDYLVVGRLLGPVALGFYVLAFNLSSWPANLISLSIRRVSIAAFSRLVDDPERLRARFIGSLVVLITVVIPVAVLLSVLASPVIDVVYGERWAPSIAALRFLALLGGMRVAFDFCYDVLVAAGRSRATLWVQGLWLTCLAPALWVGAGTGGIRGVAIAHVAVALLVVAPAFIFALSGVGIRFADLARPVMRPGAAGLLAAAVAAGVSDVVQGEVLRIALGTLAALLVYIPAAVRVRPLVARAQTYVAGRRVAAPEGGSGD
jgi:O-antigen/teichoic acid export membrane protein